MNIIHLWPKRLKDFLRHFTCNSPQPEKSNSPMSCQAQSGETSTPQKCRLPSGELILNVAAPLPKRRRSAHALNHSANGFALTFQLDES